MSKNNSVKRIVLLNKIINTAILMKDFSTANKYFLKLHKIEADERVKIGAYRLRGVY